MPFSIIEVSIIKKPCKECRIRIEELPSPMKFIVLPIALIGHAAIWIGKRSKAMHFIVLPLSYVDTTLAIVKFAFTVSLLTRFEALVTSADLVFLNYELRLTAGLAGRILFFYCFPSESSTSLNWRILWWEEWWFCQLSLWYLHLCLIYQVLKIVG